MDTNLNPICALLLCRQALLMRCFSCLYFGGGLSFSTDAGLVHKRIGKSLGQQLSVEPY